MIKVYNQSMQLVAYLENAFAVGYEERLNELWAASFSLPADDQKNAECEPLRYVEIYDGDERVDLFRIIPTETQRSADGKTITYSCEHILATLLDDVLFQYHQIGGSGVPAADVLAYVLSQQSSPRWQIGTVAFGSEYEYSFENNNLLEAVYAVTEPFEAEYQWTWDTTTTPWTLNLIAPETVPSARIRYGYNLQGITKTEDPTTLCTRLYGLGYGEGVNQLTIAPANPTGLPYVDADTAAQYGVVSKIYTDLSIDNAATLYAIVKAQLERLKVPQTTYKVEGAELWRLTDDPVDKFKSGALVQAYDEELGIDIVQRVHVRRRPDVTGAPGDVQLEIANKVQDIATAGANLSARTKIMETTAQGATNIDSANFADNCDATHPATLKVYIPEGTARINKVSLSYQVEAFRAYAKAIAAAPAITSGPSSTTTTENAAATCNTSNFGYITYDNGNMQGGVMSTDGGHSHSFSGSGSATVDGKTGTASVSGSTSSGGSHSHSLAYHTHIFTSDVHTHGMDHTHVIPTHTHDIEFGIYEGPSPSSITVAVDGNVVSGAGTSGSDIDLVPYLSVDSNGKILRGQWHEITVTPNGLGRIVATVAIQLFVQSRGGGDY